MSDSFRAFDEWNAPVLLVDADGYIRHVNPHASRVFEKYPGSLDSGHLSNIASIIPKHRQRWVQAMYSHISKTPGNRGPVALQCVDRVGAIIEAWVTFELAPNCGENWLWVQFDEASAIGHEPADKYWADPVTVRDLLSSTTQSLPVAIESETVGNLLSAFVKFESIFREFAEVVAASIKYNKIGIATVDVERQEVCLSHVIYSDLEPLPGRERGRPFPLNNTFAEAALQADGPLLFNFRDLDQLRARFPATARDPINRRALSTMVAPLRLGNDTPGVLIVQSVAADVYGESELEFMGRLTATSTAEK